MDPRQIFSCLKDKDNCEKFTLNWSHLHFYSVQVRRTTTNFDRDYLQ
jgi:hypothetical protein